MKVTQRHYRIFQQEFNRWIERFGLKGYRIYFWQEALKDSFAELDVNEDGKYAVVRLCKELHGENAKEFDPALHARHEAIHLLLHRLFWLGSCRYVRPDDLFEEWERLVRILEKVI